MKALSIKQPWASLIIEGIKDIENRTWKTNFRGRVLIHAASIGYKQYPSEILTPKQFSALKIAGMQDNFNVLKHGAIIGSVEIVDCVINHPSIWAEKTFYDDFEDSKPIWNWILANPIKFPEPISCKGKLSFWESGIEVCHICGQPTDENNLCEVCGEFYCDKHAAAYDQFSQIDFNCCKSCADNYNSR